MNDYRVNIKVRNNRILEAIERSGAESGGKWCAEKGLPYSAVNNLINMTASPILKAGHLTSTARNLCDALDKLPEDLWSDEQIRPLEKNFTSLEMSHEQIMTLMPPEDTTYLTNFEHAIDSKKLVTVMAYATEGLTPQEQEVLKRRFFDDMTLEEVGHRLGVNKERVRQIEAKALRKMRHPSRSDELRAFIGGNDE